MVQFCLGMSTRPKPPFKDWFAHHLPLTMFVSRVEPVLTERTCDTPYRIRSLPIDPAPSRAPHAFPRSLCPGICLGIPTRAPDVIYITFPGPPAHVQAPRPFPSPPSTQPVRNLSRGSRVHTHVLPPRAHELYHVTTSFCHVPRAYPSAPHD